MFLTTGAIVLSLSAPVPKGKPEIDFRVQPAATKIDFGDPLVVCVTLENNSKEPIAPKGRFDLTGNALHFELCPPDADKYRSVLAVGQGLDDSRPGSNGWPKVGAGDKVRCFGVLHYAHGDDDPAPFASRGVWRVRATLRTAGGQLTSEVVKVEVRERGKKETEIVKDITTCLSGGLNLVGHLESDRESKLKAAAKELGESPIAAVVDRMVMWRNLRHAQTPGEAEQAMEQYRTLRKKADGLEREYLDLKTGLILTATKDAARLEEVVNMIDEPSTELGILKSRLASLKREK